MPSNAWLSPELATYANPYNTFSDGTYAPETFDYIFYKVQNQSKVQIWTDSYELPLFKFSSQEDSKQISFSDHEAITSSLCIKQTPT